MSESFCLDELFPPLFWEISGNETFYGQKRGYDDFSVEFFLSHSPETFRRGTILFRKSYRVEKLYGKEGGKGTGWRITIFRQKFFVSMYRKFLWRTLVSQELVSKIFMRKRRYRVFPSKFFVSQCRHFS